VTFRNRTIMRINNGTDSKRHSDPSVVDNLPVFYQGILAI
jgi:hypothetical protein